ncbi:MAG: hypothetical protein ACE5PV_09350 [Candidatus Poribacteria bacterium]
MKNQLTLTETSNLLGLEESTIEWIVAKNDPELEPYIQRKSGNGSSEKKRVTITLDGLPTLIKKLSYNIQTADIIENLSCQVLHLEVLRQENEELKKDKLKLQQELNELKIQLLEYEEIISAAKNAGLRGAISRKLRWFK